MFSGFFTSTQSVNGGVYSFVVLLRIRPYGSTACICMYVCMVMTYSKSFDQPARGQLNREMYVRSSLIARVLINRVRMQILLVVG